MLTRLRNRLVLSNMIALSLVMIAAFGVVYFITYTNAMDEVDRKVQRVPVYLATGYDEAPQNLPGITPEEESVFDSIFGDDSQSANTQSNGNLPADFTPSFSIFLDSDGKLLSVRTHLSVPISTYGEAIASINADKDGSGQIVFEGRKWHYAYAANDLLNATSITSLDSSGNPFEYKARGITQINFVDVTETMNSLTRLLITLTVAAVIMLVALFAISWGFANRSIKPIETTWSKQKQFVADASHELKTPIAIIGANVDALESDSNATVGEQKKWIDYVRQELSRMGKLINDLLYLAQSEDGRTQVATFDLSKLVEDAATSIEAMLFEKDIRFSQSIESGIMTRADESKIKQAVLILLENAAKYTEREGWIELELVREKAYARLSVKNSGAGIDSADLDNIFDRFYRPDQSRSAESGGYGLGLSIFKTIIERAGGKIGVSSANGQTEFRFSLKIEDN